MPPSIRGTHRRPGRSGRLGGLHPTVISLPASRPIEPWNWFESSTCSGKPRLAITAVDAAVVSSMSEDDQAAPTLTKKVAICALVRLSPGQKWS